MRDQDNTRGDRAMCAAPMLTRSTWDELLYQWQELDVPEGWRAEIVEERIVMTPPPDNAHNLIADRVHKSLVRSSGDSHEKSRQGKIPRRA